MSSSVLTEVRSCARCGEMKPIDDFYFVSKATGKRRGQCKACMSDIKAMQKDPAWLPTCPRCGNLAPRSGPGRRLCNPCFDSIYDREAERNNGAHRLKLKDCSACGHKRLREDHVKHSSLCHICRSVPQGRRTRLKLLFNMTPREYVALLDFQSHRCAICERPFTNQRKAHLDHRHADPPIIRGAVCGPCNTILGLAKDAAQRLRAAAAFLDDPPAQQLFPGRVATEIANRDSWETFTPIRRVR